MRRQPFYRTGNDRRPLPPQSAEARGGGVFFLLLFTFAAVLAATGYWSPWAGLIDRAPSASSEPSASLEQQAPMLAGPASGGPLAVAVSIPPIATPLVAGALNVLPTVVMPHASGGAMPAAPLLVNQPRMPAEPIPAVLRVPAGAGPFPAVIVLHGCNGPFTGVPDWAYRLNAWGYAALMPDSMTPRGLRNVCDQADQPTLTSWDRVGDVGAAAAWLRTRSDIDPNRIAVLGLSHGGGTAALAALSPYAGIRLRAAVDYYGPCMEPRLHGSLPLLVLAGEKDDWGDPAAKCADYGKQVKASEPFELHTYPGVYHGFDAGPAAQSSYFGHIIQHNQAAAEDSFVRVHEFLDRWVRP
jgi:dienelactone hydrolase